MNRVALLAIMLGLFLAGAAKAADKPKDIDCSDTDLKLDAPGYTVKCSDMSNGTMLVDQYAAARKTQQLFAYSDSEGLFIDVIDNRTLGDRVYLKRRSLQADVEGYFHALRLENWNAGANASGFEVTEFDGGPQDMPQMECIGFRRQGQRHREGLGRIVVGIACSLGSRTKAYGLLAHLTAPGE